MFATIKMMLMNSIIRLVTFSLVFIVLVTSFSCGDCVEGEGAISIETHSVDPYTELALNIAADITIYSGNEFQIEIKAQKNILALIKTQVKGEKLFIKSTRCINTNERVKIDIIVPTLTAIENNGSGSIITKSIINSKTLDVSVNGSGLVSLDLAVDNLDVAINGSGKSILNGAVENLEFVINGSGEIRALGLPAIKADVIIRGSGDADINVSHNLNATILGSGDVIYVGEPTITSSIQGSGQLRKK